MDLTYTTQEEVELAPMDPIAEATTIEQAYDALEQENRELLVEQLRLEQELARECLDHSNTAQRLNRVEKSLVALWQRHHGMPFDGVNEIEVTRAEQLAVVNQAAERIRATVASDARRAAAKEERAVEEAARLEREAAYKLKLLEAAETSSFQAYQEGK